LPDKHKALRAWAVAAMEDYNDFAVYVELENTEDKTVSYWSNGKKILG
jgi:hypothetical protein